MDKKLEAIDPRWAWERYRPTKDAPWDLRRVGHLYRRAAFGATWAQLQEGLKAGPDAAIERLLSGGPGLAEFDRGMAAMAKVIAQSNNSNQLRAWWVVRMLNTPHPLQEKLTLFWHNHFATSNKKVQNARFMLGQYELMRRHALGNFAELLREMSRDPAMLIWLDGKDSKKGNPNENYGRELMELFSLGIGHYTEKDIREAARAFTGWELQNNEACFNKAQHDDEEKTVLGRTGKFQADDIVKICLDQPCAAPFIVAKLYRFLISESSSPPPALVAPLADKFHRSGYDFAALVRTMLSSNLFFSATAYRARIKSPVDFVLGMVRGLEGQPNASTIALSLDQLGQSLFNPPTVKGWDGGRAWLNGQTLLFRQNLAHALTSTEDTRFGSRTDPAGLVKKYGKERDAEQLDLFVKLFLQDDLPAPSQERLGDYLDQSRKTAYPVYWTPQDVAKQRVRTLCYLVLTQPEFQLD